MDAAGASFESNKEQDVLVAREMIQNMAATFLGEHGDKRDRLANPLHGDLRGLPPVYIQVGATRRCWTTAARWPRRCAGRTVR